MRTRRVVYSLPGMDDVLVQRDLPYKQVDDLTLHADIYRPPNSDLVPVVVCVAGFGPFSILKDIKDHGVYLSYGELIAASGLDALPIPVSSITTDSGYRELVFRQRLRRRGIVSYIPLGSQQVTGHPPGFVDHGDHFRCPEGKLLWPSGVPDSHGNARYATRKADCDPCPLRATCLAPSQPSKVLSASIYRREIPRAQALMTTTRYATEQERRKTIVEGVFARLDRLGGIRLRVRGLDRVNSHNGLAALAHTTLKALTKRRFWRRDGAVLPCPLPQPPIPRLSVTAHGLGDTPFLHPASLPS